MLKKYLSLTLCYYYNRNKNGYWTKVKAFLLKAVYNLLLMKNKHMVGKDIACKAMREKYITLVGAVFWLRLSNFCVSVMKIIDWELEYWCSFFL